MIPATAATAATPAHARSTSRLVLAAGLTFAATMLAALVALFVQERQQAIDAQLERNALYARVLEDHVTRSIDTAALSLATLAGTLSEQGLRGAAINPAELAQMLVSLPQLRAVAALDLQEQPERDRFGLIKLLKSSPLTCSFIERPYPCY